MKFALFPEYECKICGNKHKVAIPLPVGAERRWAFYCPEKQPEKQVVIVGPKQLSEKYDTKSTCPDGYEKASGYEAPQSKAVHERYPGG